MNDQIQLQKHAHVLASNAQEVGFLERVVVNPESNVITHIVVRMGPLFNKEDKLVPIELVTDTTEDLILLNTDPATVESMPLFEEKQMVREGLGEQRQPLSVGESPADIPLMLDGNETYAIETVQNIPEGTIAMKEGAKVIAADGEHVGHVERILADPEVDQVTHLLISRGIFSKEVKLIPTKWILKIGEENVYLNVNKESLEGLAGIPLAE